jgi:hypothetical protein
MVYKTRSNIFWIYESKTLAKHDNIFCRIVTIKSTIWREKERKEKKQVRTSHKQMTKTDFTESVNNNIIAQKKCTFYIYARELFFSSLCP